MNYKLRPGIVFTKICGQFLLIPDRKASEICHYIKQLGIISAALIEGIQNEYPIEKVYRVYEILGKKTREEAAEKIDSIAEELCEQGFLVKVSGDADETD